ncbi:2-oxo-4-hydroxy-4-carboxy-5-ureidoimidazoline decarboxylase [Chamaesiphon minutus]|uniref:2-oxo-4-hydroxy-4-carboxy-5-ureidoimidazoline decarboxylase n=1 Tax=Chamaesiphon minutus (strain ATCC 27169 / PCC 6605) TaxID=1173020 RepID=K9UBW7_CHAP6|nr:2-oxo-4-hydroxy-4-carboxy-5-ureidoimidazoline decarboxylase [Chamaesiphon minutus]AFY92133.1 OHCU decarboxylase [Chamaesiphon minutus PCC 6605]
MIYSLSQLNQMDRPQFIQALGEVFEHTPTVASQVWDRRPFISIEQLHQQMMDVVFSFDLGQKLALVRAHPDLGSKVKMAAASVQEQAGVGLDRLSASEFVGFQQLNQSYLERFDFPFIIAVKNHSKQSILEAFDRRLQNSADEELDTAIEEISQIARFRLLAIVDRVESHIS